MSIGDSVQEMQANNQCSSTSLTVGSFVIGVLLDGIAIGVRESTPAAVTCGVIGTLFIIGSVAKCLFCCEKSKTSLPATTEVQESYFVETPSSPTNAKNDPLAFKTQNQNPGQVSNVSTFKPNVNQESANNANFSSAQSKMIV